MLIKHVKVGDRVEIGFKNDKGEERRKLATVVEAVVNNDREVLVIMPMSGGTMIKLPLNRQYEAKFYAGSSVFVFDVTIMEHPIIEGVFLTRLRLDSRGQKVQVRDFYRIRTFVDFTFTIASDIIEVDELPIMNTATTKDLSAGGMSFITDCDLEEGAEIYTNFILDGEYIVLLGKTWGKQLAVNANKKFLYRCKFVAAPEVERGKVAKFVYNQQFKNIKHISE